MIRSSIGIAVGCAAVLPALAGPAAEDPRVERELIAGGIGTISVLELDCPTVFAFDRGGMRLDLRAGPDGLVEVLRARSSVDFALTGTAGARAEFGLAPGERVALWPVRWLEVRGGEGRLVVAAAAADWAFTVRADRLRGDALAVTCDGSPCELKAGERLDLDREGGRTVFRATGVDRAGEVVAEARPPAGPDVEAPAERPSAGAGEAPPTPLPFVSTEWGAWEVRPAPPVSP